MSNCDSFRVQREMRIRLPVLAAFRGQLDAFYVRYIGKQLVHDRCKLSTWP